VTVLVRPENVRIGDAGRAARGDNGGGNGGESSGGISWVGQVKQLTFRGARVSLAIETPAQSLNVESPALLRVREGDALTLFVPTLGAWAIRPDARRA
jgi:hypothetical protein